MAKYLLVSFKTCPWVQRAAIVLREKAISFEFRHIAAGLVPGDLAAQKGASHPHR
jgi:glutathione S-transferase